jgi:hypothetical protein
MGEDKEGPSVLHRTAVVAPETTNPDDANDLAQNSAKNSPMLSAKEGTFIKKLVQRKLCKSFANFQGILENPTKATNPENFLT